MRAIEAAFTADPDAAFSTDELCRAVYQREPEKRHRVAVLRALRHDPRIFGTHSSQDPFEHDDPPARLN